MAPTAQPQVVCVLTAFELIVDPGVSADFIRSCVHRNRSLPMSGFVKGKARQSKTDSCAFFEIRRERDLGSMLVKNERAKSESAAFIE